MATEVHSLKCVYDNCEGKASCEKYLCFAHCVSKYHNHCSNYGCSNDKKVCSRRRCSEDEFYFESFDIG